MLPGDTIANYKILRLLGQGGMGQVYLAVDLRLGRQVALKVISDKILHESSLLARFRREAPAAAALSHPNICAIYDVGEWEGRPYIAMEYLEGITLHELLRSRSLTIREILDIAIQIADALEEARRKNVVHRDIKSANVLITERNAKLLDFGLAKYSDLHPEVKLAPSPSEAGLVVGTVDYMSPEQALGQEADHRSDIFSFGVVLYEMLTGHLPFAGNTVAQTLGLLLHQDVEAVNASRSDIPESLSKIVEKMLQKDRDHRYQTAREVWNDLQQLRSEATQPVTLPNASVWKLGWIGSFIVLLSLASLIYLFVTFRTSNQKPKRTEQVNSILALPCKVFGPTEVAYLTDAIPSSISTLLARVPDLETRVPPTSFDVEKVDGDLNRIGKAYNVTTFVVSSITAEANRIILNVQIVEADSRKVMWSNQYEGSMQDYIDMTRNAANGIREALRPKSTSIFIPSASDSDAAANSDAELAFRKGKFYSHKYGSFLQTSDFDQARSSFQQALELDPKLAKAAGEIAWLYYKRYEFRMEKSDLTEVASWGQRALAIDKECPEGWTSLSMLEMAEPAVDLKKMMTYALRAATLGRNHYGSQMVLCNALRPVSLRLSNLAAKETHRLNPLFPYATADLMDLLIVSERSEEALPIVNELLQTQKNLPIALFYQSLIYSHMNRLPESAAIVNRLETLFRENKFTEDAFLIASEVHDLKTGDFTNASKSHERLRPFTYPFTTWGCVAFTAPLLARFGKHDETLELLYRGLKANFLPYDLLVLNPDLKKLQGDPRYQKVFSETRAKFQETLTLLEESKERGELPSYLETALQELQETVPPVLPSRDSEKSL